MSPPSDPSVWTLFVCAAERIPDRDCVVWGETRRTYAEVHRRAAALAGHLKTTGLGCRVEREGLRDHESGQDHVAILMQNRPEYVEAVLGAFAARTVPVNINYRYQADELVQLLQHSGASTLIVEDAFAERVAQIRARLPGLKTVIQVGGSDLIPGAAGYEDIVAAAAPVSFDDTRPEDVCIIYTGGTTGLPKAVLWRQVDLCKSMTAGRNPVSGARIAELSELSKDIEQGRYRVAVLPPMMHLAGLTMILIGLPAGATLLLPESMAPMDARQILSLLEAEQADAVMVVGNAMGRPLLEEARRHSYKLESIRIVVNGAAPMTSEVREGLMEVVSSRAVFFDGMGSSESGKQMQLVYRRGGTTSGAPKFERLPNTILLSEDRASIVAPEDKTEGWLASTGALPMGYMNDPVASAKTFPVVEGVRYVVAGDRARYGQDGVLELLGRDSSTINTGGEKVFAEEVEAVLQSQPGVADALVVGRPSERWGSEVVAVVALSNPDLRVEELLRSCSDKMARYKVPKAVVVVPQILRGPNGKPDYAWARATAAAAASG